MKCNTIYGSKLCFFYLMVYLGGLLHATVRAPIVFYLQCRLLYGNVIIPYQ